MSAQSFNYLGQEFTEVQIVELILRSRKPSFLTFGVLRSTNVARCEDVFHKLDVWSPTDWATAVAGEMGEACNRVKKLRRLDDADTNLDTPDYRESIADAIVEELADTGHLLRSACGEASARPRCGDRGEVQPRVAGARIEVPPVIRMVGIRPSRPQNITTAQPSDAAPRHETWCLRIMTGDDARHASGRNVAVLEVPLVDGSRVFFTAAELLAFAALMDATTD